MVDPNQIGLRWSLEGKQWPEINILWNKSGGSLAAKEIKAQRMDLKNQKLRLEIAR
jgi:hypothetical protein